jgi:hypothetical protein
MRQRLLLFGFVVFLVLLLIGLNAASYVQKPKMPDSELSPNRSSFNSGSTGTQAFYALLAETGRDVSRWHSPAAELSGAEGLATLVMIGPLKRELAVGESQQLFSWVASGGRLVLIDREPASGLRSFGGWNFTFDQQNPGSLFSTDPSNAAQMTARTPAARPSLPSRFALDVNSVQPSQFAAGIVFGRPNAPEAGHPAPVAHFAAGPRDILVTMQHGAGEVVILTDPYIVANGGIALADNAQLAINLVAPAQGRIAFDEYHQGFGGGSRFIEFFAGTPVVAIFLQAGLIALVFFVSQSRRFARPVPAPEPDRRSKLEYVAAMAQLQERARAYDLAVESVYKDLRRRASLLLGVDNTSISRPELAALIAERIGSDAAEVDRLMARCEDVIYGEPANKRTVLQIASELRDIESRLGLLRAGRRRG